MILVIGLILCLICCCGGILWTYNEWLLERVAEYNAKENIKKSTAATTSD